MNLAFYTMLTVTTFCALAAGVTMLLGRSAAAASSRAFAAALAVKDGGRPQAAARQMPTRLLAFVRWLRDRLKLTEDPRLRQRFTRAGLHSSLARDTYFAFRMLGPIAAVALGSLSPFMRVLCMCAGAGISYLAPDFVLGWLVKGRREKIRLAIPDAIDLLVICVDAGLGLDQAMLRVGQELNSSHPEIYQEFIQINREQRAGKLRMQAWREMAERTNLPETEAFVNMLMQTERFGTPIARALSNFGDGIRQKRRQKAEELAAKTTVKIIFPLVLFIFPSMFIVLLGPAGINIARGLAAAGQ